jgi:polyphenol oxidase
MTNHEGVKKLNDMRITRYACQLNQVELFGAVMAFSLRFRKNQVELYESREISNSNNAEKFGEVTNLESLCKSLKIERSNIIECDQVHGDEILVLDHVPQTSSEADAIIAVNSGLYPSVKTADCVPILIIDPVTKISAAIHAGWKGTVLRITKKVVGALEDLFGIKSRNLIASIGPAIGSCCYEVDEIVLDPLISRVPWASEFTLPSTENAKIDSRKKRLDLPGVNYRELTISGILPENIYLLKMCSFCNKERLHSYRRDGSNAGRNIAITGFRAID